MDLPYSDEYWESSDGLKLHYRDYAGPEGSSGALPVVCMHGLTRNARDFAPLAEQLSQTHRVIVPEMRGRGMSDYAKDSASYNPIQYANDVERLLDELGIDRFIAIGTSLGGLMTMLIALQKPGRIAAAVLNDVGPEVELTGVARIAGYVGQGGSFPTWMHAARTLESMHRESYPDYALEDWLDLAKRTMVIGQNGRISYDYDMAIADPFKEGGDNAAPADLWPAFEALKGAPLLLVSGALSDLISPATVARMEKVHGDMATVTIPRVGHAPTLDEPESRAAIDSLLGRTK